MALKSKAYSQAPYDPMVSHQTREFLDWVTGNINALTGQAIQSGQGSQFLNPPTINPASSQIISQGSRTQSLSTPLTYVAEPTQVGFYWDGTNSSGPIAIYLDDGTIITPLVGNLVVTGLTASTTYFFYPFYNTNTGQVQFASVSGAVGNPAVAYSGNGNLLAAQQQILRSNIPLGIKLATGGITTPSTGSTPGSGGSGGGGAGAGAGTYNFPTTFQLPPGV